MINKLKMFIDLFVLHENGVFMYEDSPNFYRWLPDLAQTVQSLKNLAIERQIQFVVVFDGYKSTGGVTDLTNAIDQLIIDSIVNILNSSALVADRRLTLRSPLPRPIARMAENW